MLGDFWRRESEWINPVRPVQCVVRFCGQRELGLTAGGAGAELGRLGSVRPLFPFHYSPTCKNSTVVCTAAQYNAGRVHGASVPTVQVGRAPPRPQ